MLGVPKIQGNKQLKAKDGMYVACELEEKPLDWTKACHDFPFLFVEHSFRGDKAKQQVGTNHNTILLLVVVVLSLCYCLVRLFVNSEWKKKKMLEWGYRENRNIYEQSRSMSRSHSPTHFFFSPLRSHHSPIFLHFYTHNIIHAN